MLMTTKQLFSYNQFNSGCYNGCIFTARDKSLARNESESEKRKQQQNQQMKTKISKQTP